MQEFISEKATEYYIKKTLKCIYELSILLQVSLIQNKCG